MEFRIADTFTASLARLTGAEQKAVKTTAFDLQLNLSSPGLRFHRLDRPRDPNFWSVRVNADVRLIVHKTPTSLLLCLCRASRRSLCVGRAAADRAPSDDRRRATRRTPRAGRASIADDRLSSQPAPRSRSRCCSPGSPTMRCSAMACRPNGSTRSGEPTRTRLFDIADHLPQEAAEALLEPGDRHDPGDAGTRRRSRPTRSPIPTRSAGSAC